MSSPLPPSPSQPPAPAFEKNNTGPGRIAFGIGCIIILSLAAPAFFIGAFVFGWGANLPILGDLLTQGTVTPPGNLEKFDLIETYPEVKKYAGNNAQLTSLSARYVNSDGTLNLKAKYGSAYASITYDFFNKLDQAPENAPPIGAGGSKNGNWYEPVRVTIEYPGQTRYMSRIGGAYNFKGNYLHQGMERDVSTAIGEPYSDIVSAPVCSFKDFWDTAIKQGAPADAVASIDYDYNGYTFSISDTDIELEFSPTCQEK